MPNSETITNKFILAFSLVPHTTDPGTQSKELKKSHWLLSDLTAYCMVSQRLDTINRSPLKIQELDTAILCY